MMQYINFVFSAAVTPQKQLSTINIINRRSGQWSVIEKVNRVLEKYNCYCPIKYNNLSVTEDILGNSSILIYQ